MKIKYQRSHDDNVIFAITERHIFVKVWHGVYIMMNPENSLSELAEIEAPENITLSQLFEIIENGKEQPA